MHLIPHEQERLLLSSAAVATRRRRVVRRPLPVGWVTTALCREPHHAVAEAAALDGTASSREPV